MHSFFAGDPSRFSTLKLSFVFIFLCLTISSAAQDYAAPRSITVKQGLPQGFVSGIVQDDNDFIWLATRDGLARYDGREFKVFRANDDRATSISTNVITGLYRDPKNRIWILHESLAIDVFDPVTEKFSCFTCDSVNAVIATKQISPNFAYVDSRDNLWLINFGHGFWKKDLKNKKIKLISKRTANLLSDTVRGIIETRNHQYWVFSSKGMQLFDESDQVQKNVPFDFSSLNTLSNQMSIESRVPLSLTFINDDQMLVRSWDIVFLFNTKELTMTPVINKQGEFFFPNITNLQKDPSGNIIVEIMGSLFQIGQDQTFEKIWDGKGKVESFYIDRSGVAWLGNEASGILTIDLRSAVFKSKHYKTGFVNDMLSANGIKIDKTSWLNYTSEYRYGFDSQTRFEYDSKNRLWLTQGSRTTFYDFNEKRLRELPPLETKTPSHELLPSAIANDTCWHLAAGNPVYYNIQKSSWTYPLGKNWTLAKSCTVSDIIKIGNTIWGTTSHEGLLAINLSIGKVEWYRQESGQLPTNELLDIERDLQNDSLVWIGTRNGLTHFNIRTATSKTFGVKDGLPNNTIYCIVADADNFLWLSTNRGLCRFDPESFRVLNFSVDDGLQGDEFNQFHKLKLPDGRIAFGGTDGYTVFDPRQVQNDRFQPKVQLTKLRINNREIEPAFDSSIVNTPLNSLTSLKLKYDQNFITFYFAGLQFNNVGKIQYRYRLKGFDRDWNRDALGIATYTKIPPGNYELELNVTNTAGTWSKNFRRISIILDPPFWRTNLAYLFYVILFVTLIFIYIRYTTRKIRLENLVQLKNKEAEQLKQLDEAKSRFFTNITHEFRTPLTLIMSPLEQLLKASDLKESQKRQLLTAQQNSTQILQLINQILELSKLEVGLLQVSTSPISLNKFLERLITPFHSVANHKQLALHFECGFTDDEYFVDEAKLERMVNNLLTNAIKFTPANGSVRLVISKATGETPPELITFKVIDTGIGISPEALPFVFDRFYQADDKSNRAYGGTGIGLSLVRELTHLLKGTITVESAFGKGTTFTITLPLMPAGGAQPLVTPDLKINTLPQAVVVDGLSKTNPASTTGKPMVLIVEDNESLRGFLTEQLTDFYSVITAPNGREAWEKVLAEMPELIVTDVMMPYMDGVELSKKVRETEATSHIGLIMLTAKASAVSRFEGLQTGVNDYISKPFSVDELQLRIANLLAHQKRQREYFHGQLLKNEPSKHKDVENEFLKKAYNFLDMSLAQKATIGVEDLADHMNMSSRTLNRKLSTLLGLSPNELIRNYRLNRATTLLMKNLSISEVAYEVGFESSQYFAQCFKAVYYVSPTEYIQRQSFL
jgi:signal transduction histidine kinase/DNA-binding response OmpR family regulator/ligand-binding sensor domain-containing protein